MPATTIINAAPMVLNRGTQDLSTRQVPREVMPIPQHLAKIYIYAKKGDNLPQLMGEGIRDKIYGADTFDMRKKWGNHATELANKINAQGNVQILQRVIPLDAGPEANVLFSLDVLATEVPLYQRNVDGSIVLTAGGLPVPVAGSTTVPGYKVKWVTSHITELDPVVAFGQADIGPGDQTDGENQSVRYPMFELKANSRGSDGNNAGTNFWAPNIETASGFNTRLLNEEKTYPFNMAVIKRADALSSPQIIETLFGEQDVTFGLKPGTIDPLTGAQLYIGDVILSSWQDLNDPLYPAIYGEFGAAAIYDENIKTVLDLFYAAETAGGTYVDEFSDFTLGATDEEYLFNIFNGRSSKNVPYHTFQMVSDDTSVRMSESSNVYANGGSDGTMNDTLFAALVETQLAEYADENSPVQNDARNPESIMYDSGFPLSTKKALANFISIRKDTFVVVGTHVAGDAPLTASEEHSLALSLNAHYSNYPESTYYGTPVMRFLIMGRSGKLRNSLYTKRIPATFEVAIKAARYMGAADGRWKSGFNFDGAPGSILEFLTDVNVSFTPATVRNKDWSVGLNWVQAYDYRSLFIPAFKTGYNNDTSVLNSFSTAMAIVQINKVTSQVWREFSGVDHLTNAQLIERVNESVSAKLNNRFDNRFVIVPEAYMTDADLARGFSWTLPVTIYAANMKTVMTTMVKAMRIDDLNTVA